jgi:hypothetical protein
MDLPMMTERSNSADKQLIAGWRRIGEDIWNWEAEITEEGVPGIPGMPVVEGSPKFTLMILGRGVF